MVKGITANNVDEPAWRQRRRLLPAQPRRPADHAEDRGLGLRSAGVQPRRDRRIPDRHQPVRHHAGPVGRHPGAGDLEIGHQQHERAASTDSSATTRSTRPTRSRRRCCPYSDQQIGGTFGGPIIKDKLHYFVSYRVRARAGHDLLAPAGAARADLHRSRPRRRRRACWRAWTRSCRTTIACRSAVRAGTGDNPFNLGGGGYPSTASRADRYATNVLGTWSHVDRAATRCRRSASATTTSSSAQTPLAVGGRHAGIRLSRA